MQTYFAVVLMALASSSVNAAQSVDVSCTEAFCKDYLDKVGCPKLPEHCTEKNLLQNPDAGILLPSPTTCNCCNYCLTYLTAGSTCVAGSVDQPLPSAICGPKLSCAKVSAADEDSICMRINSTCTRAQDEWDGMRLNGTLGSHIARPECDHRGDFIPAHCIPGLTCYCVSPDGDRLLGEIPLESDSTSEEMLCPCSLNQWRASKVFPPESMLVSRCAADGRFDALQCVDSKCFCVDVDDGTLVDKKYAHVVDLEEDVLPCFDPLIHADGVYLKPCEQAKFDAEQKLGLMFEEGVIAIGPRAPTCDAAGDYASMQDRGVTKRCVDPNNKMLENYEVSKSSPGAKLMNCNCARTRWLLRGLINSGHAVELPKCCDNGNYAAWQCRRGLCYCVDSGGNQNGLEYANPSKLKCWNTAGSCAIYS